MKVKVDREAGALYLRLDDSRIIDSEEVRPGVILDYNEREEVVGIEILAANTHLEPGWFNSIVVETA